MFGWSGYSDVSTLITRMVPEKPAEVSTALIGTNVEIAWLAPDERGTTIQYYEVQVVTSEGVQVSSAVYCTLVAGLGCSFPMAVLTD